MGASLLVLAKYIYYFTTQVTIFVLEKGNLKFSDSKM